MAVPETLIGSMPHDLEAERAVLGAVLIDSRHTDYVIQKLFSDAFYHHPHRLIFEAVKALYDRQEAVDLVTVVSELKSQQKTEAAGGISYVASLTDGVPRTINVEQYVRLVQQKSMLRQLLWATREIGQECLRQEQTAAEILEKAERRVFEIAEGYVRPDYVRVGALLTEILERVQERQKNQNPITGVETGFKDLDDITGGLQKSNLVIVAARPSVGKSSFCLNIAAHAALHGGRSVAIFSIEDSKEYVIRRMLCSRAKVNSRDMDRGMLRREDWTKLMGAKAEFDAAPIFIDDSPATILDIKTKARRIKSEAGLDMIVVDYLQLIQSPEGAGVENRAREIALHTQALKNLAKELEIPVVVASQLNRATELRPDGQPKLADLRESGAIEQDADLVAFLVRPDMYKKSSPGEAPPDPYAPREADVYIAKHRNGATGKVRLLFFPSETRFGNLEPGASYSGME